MDTRFESKGLKKLRNDVIQGYVVEELLNDTQITLDRRDVCSLCEHMDTKNCMCSICKCFLEIKTKSKVNKVLDKQTLLPVGSEITYCPLDKWNDEFSKLGYSIKHDLIKSES